MAILSAGLLYTLSLIVVGAQTETQEIPDEQVAQLSRHISDFSMRLYNWLEKQRHENVGLSPLSLYIAMGNLMAGASGKTREEMEMVLGYTETCQGTPCEDQPEAVLGHLYSKLNMSAANEGQVTLNVANALFLNKQYKIKESYWTLVRDYFQTDLRPFSKTLPKEFLADLVNSYVAEETNGMIKEALQNVDMEDIPISIIVNVLYFNGMWKVPFDKNKTAIRPFWFTHDQVVNVSTMFVEGRFRIGRNEAAGLSIIELEYGGSGEFSMLLAVPDQPDDLNTIEANITELMNVRMSVDRTKLYLPRFSINYGTELLDALRYTGLQITFGGEGRFENMYQADKKIKFEVSSLSLGQSSCAW